MAATAKSKMRINEVARHPLTPRVIFYILMKIEIRPASMVDRDRNAKNHRKPRISEPSRILAAISPIQRIQRPPYHGVHHAVTSFSTTSGLAPFTRAAAAGQSVEDVRLKWVGAHLNLLIEKHGEPDALSEAINGNRVFEYVKTKTKYHPRPIYRQPMKTEIDEYQVETGLYSHGTATTEGGWMYKYDKEEVRCTGYFEMDADDRIVNVWFEGEGCPR